MSRADREGVLVGALCRGHQARFSASVFCFGDVSVAFQPSRRRGYVLRADPTIPPVISTIHPQRGLGLNRGG